MTLQSRGYTVGFLDGNAGPEAQNYDEPGSQGIWRFTGVVHGTQNNKLLVEVKDKITVGMTLQGISPNQFNPISFKVKALFDGNNNPLETVSAGKINQLVQIESNSKKIADLPPLSVLRKQQDECKN